MGGNGPGIVTTFRPAVSSYDARDARKVRRAPRETAEDGLGRVAPEIMFGGFARRMEDFLRDARADCRTEGHACPGPFRATPTVFLGGGRRGEGPCKALAPLSVEPLMVAE